MNYNGKLSIILQHSLIHLELPSGAMKPKHDDRHLLYYLDNNLQHSEVLRETLSDAAKLKLEIMAVLNILNGLIINHIR